MNKVIIMLACIVMFSCQSEEANTAKKQTRTQKIESGSWKFSFFSQKYEIPIRARIENDKLIFINGDENVAFSFVQKGDSLFVPIPNFDSHIEGVIQSPTLFKGIFVKDYVDDYSIQFIAERSDENVFGKPEEKGIALKEKYKTEFYFGDEVSPAIGVFEQKNATITGSFAKETGDYRYLEGLVDGSTLKLSTFDGSHLYLFTAEIVGDSLVNGKFISGKGGSYTWSSVYDPEAKLRNPEHLTFLKEGYSTFSFDALDLDNNVVHLEDKSFDAKLKIIQISGTWCPNCLDETRYFTKLYSKYHDKGLEIIALCFENGKDTLKVLEKLTRYKENNEIEYPLFYAGKSGSDNASEAFPMLNKIMSFPTAIYLDENNEVIKIYTGFYGPGTGEYFIEYTSRTEEFIESILN